MKDLTGFQRDLLYVIAAHDGLHGLEIKTELEDYYVNGITHSRLYPNLNTLVEQGLVNKSEIDGRTNAYTISHRGQRELTARREWEETYFTVEESAPAQSD